ncbi:acylphosphatase [Roseisolibacter sp. H3M3-2]|uniref:acylphosphatase n=1 Tax=Roseisolibacter sp. H3M3-2 TaxID=3031323 RepID=UPI0023DA967A|nr:acylphosphatase [Roseisolibacter sp. H3M3-2]MDF1502631.1 acylphosphatase [Roseisolibacter sp. H3M3-2]
MSDALHVRVEGRVQRVGFRWFVREEATRLGLAGWVRNLPDGAVEVAASGEPDALAALRAALARGPQGARVAAVADLPPLDPPPAGPFDILRD